MQISFSKMRIVISQNRVTQFSAGFDVYVPEDFAQRYVMPNESVLIPSGIKVDVPQGHALIAFNKSGVAVKKSMVMGACVVDEDYQGEVHLHLINVGHEGVMVSPGDKLAQFLLLPVNYAEPREVPLDSLYDEETQRGEGAFGSTGVR